MTSITFRSFSFKLNLYEVKNYAETRIGTYKVTNIVVPSIDWVSWLKNERTTHKIRAVNAMVEKISC